MINSRKLEDLHPYVAYLAQELIDQAHAAGIDLLVTSTFRDNESQAQLYAQGRTAPGPVVTNARPGYSFHQHHCAFDVVPLKNGKPLWSTSGPDGQVWATLGQLGVNLGLEWAGNWKTFREYPHFQYTAGLTITDFLNGRTLDDVIEVHYEDVPTQ